MPNTFESALQRDGLPANVHTERVVLGIMLTDSEPQAVQECVSSMREDFFSLDSHRRIYRAIMRLAHQQEHVDYITVIQALQSTNELETVGGRAQVMSLTEDLPRHLAVDRYRAILEGLYSRRRMIELGERAMHMALDNTTTPEEAQAFLGSGLSDLATAQTDTRMERMGEFIEMSYPRRYDIFTVTEKERGLPTGLKPYDDLTGGLHRGELTIFAARPGCGKTAWAATLTGKFVGLKYRAAVFPMEQGKLSMTKRVACGMAMASFKDLRGGTSDETDRRYLIEEMRRMEESSIYWSDQRMTMSMLRARCSRLQRELGGLDAILIDQLSWIDLADQDQKAKRYDQIGEVAFNAKSLAKELNVPVILFCQLSRPDRTAKEARKPQLHDLAESGKLEAHADVVAFAHRPEVYDRNNEELRGKAEILIAKNRDGQTGDIDMKFNGHCMRWEALDGPLY